MHTVLIWQHRWSICFVYSLTRYNSLQTEQFCIPPDEMALPSYSLPTLTFRIYSVGSQLDGLSRTLVWRRHTIYYTANFSGTGPVYPPFQYIGLCPHLWGKCTLFGSLHGLDFANDSGGRENCVSIRLFVDFEVSITPTVQPQDRYSPVCNQMQG